MVNGSEVSEEARKFPLRLPNVLPKLRVSKRN